MKSLILMIRISKGYMVKNNIFALKRDFLPGFTGLFLCIHHVANALKGDAGLAHLRNHPADHPDRPYHHGIIGKKSDIASNAEFSSQTKYHAECQHT